MISVIVYGRNDAHGYNPHRRVALSLNCIAELLTDSDDEIVFVDYNTPDGLPTLVEALADTLTESCRARLRVIRVSAEVHARRFASRTHLPIVEPVARNVAARRSNPANRWLLSTTTDMIFVATAGRSLSAICADLPDGYYCLPRFELPEWMWERLPRTDPRRTIDELRRLGPRLRLDEPTLNHEWIRFDAPGDFQLVLREDFFAVDGFDEEMLLGWHVDSNLSRRLFLHRGSIETLEERVAGYHCNHSRTATVYHGEGSTANDLDRFFFSVEAPSLPEQRNSWGLAELALPAAVVQPGPPSETSLVSALVGATASTPTHRRADDVQQAKFSLTYDSPHVLPFVVDSLVVSPGAVTAYVGCNSALRPMLQHVVRALGIPPLLVPSCEDPGAVVDAVREASIIIVDLGMDYSLASAAGTVDDEQADVVAPALQSVFDAFRAIVEAERARIAEGQQSRRFVLVNSTAAYWNGWVLAQLHCSHSTMHSRVRHATVKPTSDEHAERAMEAVNRHLRWKRRRAGQGAIELRSGEVCAVASIEDFDGFGSGWMHPDSTAIWTTGPRAELSLATGGHALRPRRLRLALCRVGVDRAGWITVEAVVNGTAVAVRRFRGSERDVVWRVPVPPSPDGRIRLALSVCEPVEWADARRLGLHIESFTLEPAGWRGHAAAARDALTPVLRRLRRAAARLRRATRPRRRASARATTA